MWAASTGFNIKPNEMQQVVAGFKQPDTMFASGFHIAGDKMITIKSDERSIYGKSVRRSFLHCERISVLCMRQSTSGSH